MSRIVCIKCQGAGRVFDSECADCEGSGNHVCDSKGCNMQAVAFNNDGKALCGDCLMDWADEEYGQ
jgi:hypothetical protein